MHCIRQVSNIVCGLSRDSNCRNSIPKNCSSLARPLRQLNDSTSKSPKELTPILDRSTSGMSAWLILSIFSVKLKILSVMRSGAGSPLL